MRKLLTATTALALVGGAASAELSMSGDAELGVDYDSSAGVHASKHSFAHEVGIDFSGSGTTDGGLSFGGSAGFDTGDDTVNAGSVFVSGAFGKITIGDNDAADLLAGGIADVGLNGVGVDDVAEGVRGGTAAAFRYDNSFGQIAIAISAGTSDGTAAVEGKNGLFYYALQDGAAAIGENFFAASSSSGPGVDAALFSTAFTAAFMAPVGTDFTYSAPADGARLNNAGRPATGVTVVDGEATDAGTTVLEDAALASYNHYVANYDLGADNAVGGENANADTPIADVVALRDAVAEMNATGSDNQYAFGMSFEANGVTVGIGYDSEKTISMGIGFTTGDISTNLLYAKGEDATGTMDTTGMGADMSYTFGASTLTLAYARQETDMHGGVTHDAVGMNVGHDLGGGASVVAGFGRVESRDDDAGGMVSSANKASAGLKFSF